MLLGSFTPDRSCDLRQMVEVNLLDHILNGRACAGRLACQELALQDHQ